MGLRNGKNHLKIGDLIRSCSLRRITAIAITLTILVFLIYYEFTAMLPGYAPPGLYSLIALSSMSGAVGFQLIGIWYLLSRLDRAFKDEVPSITCYQGDGCPHTAVKRILNDNKFYVRFIATFLSLFIAIEIVNALTGTTPFLSLRLNSLLSILFDIFNHAVTFINYLLLGTILWILFGTVSAVGKIKSARSAESGLSGSFIIYCPDRVGGLSSVKRYLFCPLYIFLASVTLLMIGYIDLLPAFYTFSDCKSISFFHCISYLFVVFFSPIANFCVFSFSALFGVALTIIGLNRLSSICLKRIDDRIEHISAKYDDSLKMLLAMSPDEICSSERGNVSDLL